MDKHEIEGDEVIEREVKATGNGAHVYVPKDWLDRSVKVVKTPDKDEPEFDTCDICNRATTNTDEWCWTDDSGGALFQICTDCQANVGTGPTGSCGICQEDRERSKSEGFGVAGTDLWYVGCDTCRERVIFGNTPSPQPAWIE